MEALLPNFTGAGRQPAEETIDLVERVDTIKEVDVAMGPRRRQL
jgi:hypothetical protein